MNTIDKDCTFCSLSRYNLETSETPLHLFFDCQHVEPVLKNVYNWLYVTVQEEHISRQAYFIVPHKDNNNDTKFLVVWNAIIKKSGIAS